MLQPNVQVGVVITRDVVVVGVGLVRHQGKEKVVEVCRVGGTLVGQVNLGSQGRLGFHGTLGSGRSFH